MPSLFTRIINGEIPSYKIYEDDQVFAFLDIHPMRPGHTLLIPKLEVPYFADLPAETASHLMIIAQKITKALDQATGCHRTQLLIAGRDVPHTHIHLVPSESAEDIRSVGDANPSPEEMKKIQNLILSFL